MKKILYLSAREFASGIAFIERNIRLGRKVFVHCNVGKGSSPSYIAASSFQKISVIALIQEKSPRANRYLTLASKAFLFGRGTGHYA